MSADLPCIARKTDHIVHDGSQAAAFEAWFLTSVGGVAVGIAVTIIFAPGAVVGAFVVAGLTVAEWVLNDMATTHLEARALEHAGPAVPEIATGSSDVWANNLQAARGPGALGPDWLQCQAHGRVDITQGSSWVLVNLSPAARYKDRTRCPGGAHLTFGQRPTKPVYVGGPPTPFDNRMPAHRVAAIAMPLLRAGAAYGALASTMTPITATSALVGETAGYAGGEAITAGRDWYLGGTRTLPGAPVAPGQ